MRLIPTPAWARAFERSVDVAFGDAEYGEALAQHEAVMAAVQQAVQTYVDDTSLTVDIEVNGFPSRQRLTGEYYVGRESYWVNDETWFERLGRTREYCFSVEARCLEHRSHPDQADQDYLGLEVQFMWYPGSGTFEHTGDVDSSSI